MSPDAKTETKPGQAKNGMASIDLAESAYRIFCACTGIKIPWADNAYKISWEMAALHAIDVMQEAMSMNNEIKIHPLAECLSKKVYPEVEYSKSDMNFFLAWDSIVRHFYNCINSEEGLIDIKEAEAECIAWAMKKIRPSQAPVQMANDFAALPAENAQPVNVSNGKSSWAANSFRKIIGMKIAEHESKIAALKKLLGTIGSECDEALAEIFRDFLGKDK